MSNAWKIYMLAVVNFLVGTSEFIIAGILDKVVPNPFEQRRQTRSRSCSGLLFFAYLIIQISDFAIFDKKSHKTFLSFDILFRHFHLIFSCPYANNR